MKAPITKIISICSILIITLSTTMIETSPSTVFADRLQLHQVPEVNSNKMWTVSFKDEINPQTISHESIYVINDKSEKVKTELKIDDDYTKVYVNPPNTGYHLKQSYTLIISESIKYQSGMKLGKEVLFPFAISNELPTVSSKEHLEEIFTEAKSRQTNGKAMRQAESVSVRTEKSADSAASEETSYSTTNNQVNDVDEADTVKTDGTHIYSIQGRSVAITKAVPIEDLSITSTLEYDNNFTPQQLFLGKGKLVVIGNQFNVFEDENTKKQMSMIAPSGSVKAIVYDITRPSQPEQIREIEMDGRLITARMIDSFVYLVSNKMPMMWKEQPTLRPSFKDSSTDNKMKPIPYEQIQYIPGSYETNYTMISSFNIENPDEQASVTTYLGSGNQIYMSKDSLYLAISKYPEHKDTYNYRLESLDTYIYKFRINEASVVYQSNAIVEGRLLNQFSMDERGGYFRITTTKGFAWQEDAESTNHLFVLDDDLKVVGKLNDLAPGEQIYSVRFTKDRAYMVTFKTVDPLFVIDLKNPEQPKVLGELKIPGFSNYLHPYGENHVIGFGQSTKDVPGHNGEPRIITDGIKISIFDVTNVNEPKEKYTEIIEGQGTHSQLNHDHKALLFDHEKGLFAFPITIYKHEGENWVSNKIPEVFQGAYVYHLNLDQGFDLKAKISHRARNMKYPEWHEQISRLLYIENNLYSLSPGKMMVHDMKNYQFKSELTFPIPN